MDRLRFSLAPPADAVPMDSCNEGSASAAVGYELSLNPGAFEVSSAPAKF